MSGEQSEGDRFHLLLVHSHITHIVARGVIKHCRLHPDQVAFLTTRGFRPPGESDEREPPIIPFEFTLVPRRRKERPSLLQGWKVLKAIDDLLADVTAGRPFHLYTPQTMEHVAQVLKNNPACSGFSFIEEGLYSYCTREEIERTHPPRRPRLWERLAYRNRIRSSRFFDPGNERAYGIHASVFPGMHGRVVLKDAFRPAAPEDVAGIDHVLVFDALAAYQRIELDSLLAALRRLLSKLAEERVAALHYKLHPAQKGTAEQTIIEQTMAAAGVPVVRLADEVALENLALARPSVRWFVNLSSVGLYASLFGCPVYSYANWIAEIEPGFRRHIDQTPRIFAEHVRSL
jgi:hypothetical protein